MAAPGMLHHRSQGPSGQWCGVTSPQLLPKGPLRATCLPCLQRLTLGITTKSLSQVEAGQPHGEAGQQEASLQVAIPDRHLGDPNKQILQTPISPPHAFPSAQITGHRMLGIERDFERSS